MLRRQRVVGDEATLELIRVHDLWQEAKREASQQKEHYDSVIADLQREVHRLERACTQANLQWEDDTKVLHGELEVSKGTVRHLVSRTQVLEQEKEDMAKELELLRSAYAEESSAKMKVDIRARELDQAVVVMSRTLQQQPANMQELSHVLHEETQARREAEKSYDDLAREHAHTQRVYEAAKVKIQSLEIRLDEQVERQQQLLRIKGEKAQLQTKNALLSKKLSAVRRDRVKIGHLLDGTLRRGTQDEQWIARHLEGHFSLENTEHLALFVAEMNRLWSKRLRESVRVEREAHAKHTKDLQRQIDQRIPYQAVIQRNCCACNNGKAKNKARKKKTAAYKETDYDEQEQEAKRGKYRPSSWMTMTERNKTKLTRKKKKPTPSQAEEMLPLAMAAIENLTEKLIGKQNATNLPASSVVIAALSAIDHLRIQIIADATHLLNGEPHLQPFVNGLEEHVMECRSKVDQLLFILPTT